MKNAIIRALRTWLQVLIGLLIAGWADVADFGDALSLAQTALVASIPALLSLVQNLLENETPLDVGPAKG